jgi:hypothetical protein
VFTAEINADVPKDADFIEGDLYFFVLDSMGGTESTPNGLLDHARRELSGHLGQILERLQRLNQHETKAPDPPVPTPDAPVEDASGWSWQ